MNFSYNNALIAFFIILVGFTQYTFAYKLIDHHGHHHDQNKNNSNTTITNLSSAEFELFVTRNPIVLIDYFSPSQDIEYIFQKVAFNLKKHDVSLAKINCSKEFELCLTQNIISFPTLRVFNHGDEPIDYLGEKSIDGITQFMLSQNHPNVSFFNETEDLYHYIHQSNLIPVMVLTGGIESPFHSIFTEMASLYQSEYQLKFAQTTSNVYQSEYGVDKILLFDLKYFEDPAFEYEGDGSYDSVAIWFKRIIGFYKEMKRINPRSTGLVD